MELADYQWLVGNEAAEVLERLGKGKPDTLAVAASLRKQFSPERTHLLLEQLELRRRAEKKFVLAGQMYFTPLGFEQSTDEVVAAYKAARFPLSQPTGDFCCGMGGDLLALAQGRRVLAVDRDPIAAVLAHANCRLLENPQVDYRVAEVTPEHAAEVAAWHMDPDRRASGRRTTRVEAMQPDLAAIQRLLARQPTAAIKLAPATGVPESWQDAELEWISRARQCRQLVVWHGALARHGGRRVATMLVAGGEPRTLVGDDDENAPLADHIGRYVFEPDAAVLAARLTATLADELNLRAITPGIAYLTGDRPLDDPAVSCFEVREVLPFDARRVKAWLRERGIGRLEVKKRGVDHEPAKIQKQLEVAGAESATLLLTRVDGKVTAILATRATGAAVSADSDA